MHTAHCGYTQAEAYPSSGAVIEGRHLSILLCVDRKSRSGLVSGQAHLGDLHSVRLCQYMPADGSLRAVTGSEHARADVLHVDPVVRVWLARFESLVRQLVSTAWGIHGPLVSGRMDPEHCAAHVNEQRSKPSFDCNRLCMHVCSALRMVHGDSL